MSMPFLESIKTVTWKKYPDRMRDHDDIGRMNSV